MNILSPELLPDKQLNRIISKQTMIHEFQHSGLTQREFALKRGVSLSTLRRDLERTSRGVPAFIDKRSQRIRKGARIIDQCLAYLIAFKVVHPKATLKSAWEELEPVARENGWTYPNYCQVIRALQMLPPDMKTMLFENSREHFIKWGLVPRIERSFSNDEWQMDFSELDFWCLDTASGKLFKPYLSAVIDCYSRIILKVVAHRQCPAEEDSLYTLREAILPKNSPSDPFYGIPVTLCTDNGSIYTKSAAFMDCLLRLNITHRDIPPNSPASNGKIERWFQTFKTGLLKKLYGYSGQFLGLQRAQKQAIPWPVFQKIIDDFRMEYHLKEHREISTTPWQKWHENILNAKNLVFDAKDVIKAARIRKEALVGRDGIECDKKIYQSPKLAGLVGKKVILRLLPEGNDPTPECYHGGNFIDVLTTADQSQLAQAINTARLDRVEEIRQLRKQMKAVADKIIHPGGAITHQSTESGNVSSTTPPEEPLGPIEKLKTTEEE